MKSKSIISVGIFSLLIFTISASFLWYLYFVDCETKVLAQNKKFDFVRGVELVNGGSTTYLDATNNDNEENIPVYYFRVKNSTDSDFNYVIYFENAEVNDGCTKETTLSREELEFELTLDNKVIRSGGLEIIHNNILDVNTILKNSVNDYSIKVKIKPDTNNYANKHFHYKITMKEKE